MSVLDTHRAFHFMGIGGAGMSALAELLAHRGYDVSGCDARRSPATERLERLGLTISIGHDPSHLTHDRAVIVSSAIDAGNGERRAAEDSEAPVVMRAELLGAVLAGGHGIAVAGTHGKSTTTTMTGALLDTAGWDPTVIVGGRIRGQSGNVRIGEGPWIVAEADEFDRSFLSLSPSHAIISNIEPDHLDTYETAEAVAEAFALFIHRIEPGGTLVLGIDDPGVRAVSPPSSLAVLRFGLDRDADVRAERIETRHLDTRFTLVLPDGARSPIELSLPGRHNVRNALAAAAMAFALGVTPRAIAAGLASVRGVERRFEIVYEDGNVIIVDDYAHHPTEIEATLESAREGWPGHRLVVVFQPHLYSRTRDFAADFGRALALADVVVLTDIYPAREKPIDGVTSSIVADAVRSAGGPDPQLAEPEAVVPLVAGIVSDGDLVLTMGAGDVDTVARALADERRRTVSTTRNGS